MIWREGEMLGQVGIVMEMAILSQRQMELRLREYLNLKKGEGKSQRARKKTDGSGN
jgi:hypothetical protein